MTMPTPTVYKFSVAPYSPVLGPDDNIWLFGNGITVISKSGVLVATYGSTYTFSSGFVLAGDVYSWGSSSGTTYLIKVTSSGTVTQVTSVPTQYASIFYAGGYIVGITLAASGYNYIFNHYTTAGANPLQVNLASFPGQCMALGSDSNIWSGYGTNGFMMTQAGAETEYTNLFPGGDMSNDVYGTIPYNGYVWLADLATGKGVWRINTTPTASQITVSTTSVMDSLTIGVDGYLYALDNDTTTNAYGTLWQIDPSTLSVVDSVACPAVETGDSAAWKNIYSDGTYLWMVNQQSSVCRWSGLAPSVTPRLVMPL